MRFTPAEYRAHLAKRSQQAEPVGESRADEILKVLLAHFPDFAKEVSFHPLRKWKFDYANSILKIAIEIEGVTHEGGGGRHQRPEGYAQDCTKYNAAQLLGWIVLRYTPQQILMDEASDQILHAIELQKRSALSATMPPPPRA